MTNAFQTLLTVLALTWPWIHAARAQAVRENSVTAALARPVALDQAWPSTTNPAALATLPGFALALHAGRPYHIPGLLTSRVEAGMGGAGRAAAVTLERLGYEDFAQTTATVQAAIDRVTSARTTFALGLRFAARRAAPRGYPAERSAAVDVGWMAAFDSVVYLGASMQHFGAHGTDAASGVAAGIGWNASRILKLLLQVHRERGFPAQFGFGVQVWPHEALAVRTGISTSPLLLCGGLGIRVRRLHVDVALISHPVLGLSSSITVGIHRTGAP